MDEQNTRRQPPLANILTQAWLPLAIVAAWFAVSAGSANPYWPPLQKILESLGTGFAAGTLWSDLAFSFTNYFLGLAAAFVAALALGILVGEVELLRKAFMPFLDFARATPHVSFVPVIILAFGIGAGPKVFLIAFGCLWPILLNTIEGIRTIPASIHESSRAYRIPLRLRIFKIILPGALPQIVVGVRVAISVGIVMLLVSEMFGAEKGIGYFIVQSGANFAIPETWAGTIVIGVIGYLLSMAFAVLEKRLLRWHHRDLPQEKKQPKAGAARPAPAAKEHQLQS
jgi:ABC-type nitrate/sulfonate/bicarbonate transport system permease component